MRRERAAGYYAELAWAAGEMVVELPYLLLQTCLYSVITYFMIWFEINAGEDDTYTLHAIQYYHCAIATIALTSGLLESMLVKYLHEPCRKRNLQYGICSQAAGLSDFLQRGRMTLLGFAHNHQHGCPCSQVLDLLGIHLHDADLLHHVRDDDRRHLAQRAGELLVDVLFFAFASY